MTITLGVDTFATVEEADAFMANRLYADDWPIHIVEPLSVEEIAHGWKAVDTTKEDGAKLKRKEQALRLATQILTNHRYLGLITSITQPLAWPRSCVRDREGRQVPENTIPQVIKQATAELALILLREDLTNDSTHQNLYRLTESSVGQSSAKFTPHAGVELPQHVKSLISQFLESQYSMRIEP
jgi:hypothetical protein